MFGKKIFKSLGLDELTSPFEIFVLGFEKIIIEGKSLVKSFSQTKIILNIAKQDLLIYGNNLLIEETDNNHIIISGQIDFISKKEITFK